MMVVSQGQQRWLLVDAALPTTGIKGRERQAAAVKSATVRRIGGIG
jgi:hypothetical protein